MRALGATAALAAAALVAAGCGSSSSSADQAKSKACAAYADIGDQITKLQGISSGSTSPSDARGAIQAIGTDVGTIRQQAPHISGQLKQQLQTANATFRSDVQQVVSSVQSADSLSGAATALTNAAGSLQASYKKAFAGISC